MKIRWKIVLASGLSLVATVIATQAFNINLFNSKQNQVIQMTEELLYKELSERLTGIGKTGGEKIDQWGQSIKIQAKILLVQGDYIILYLVFISSSLINY